MDSERWIELARAACGHADIDWADAVIGPQEWDIAFLWHWNFSYEDRSGSFTQDREAMDACLASFFAGSSRPDRFARRCLAALSYSH